MWESPCALHNSCSSGRFLCARLHEREHCPYTQKGQANFTNNVLIDPSLVMLQLFLFLCLPTRAANNRKWEGLWLSVRCGALCFSFLFFSASHTPLCEATCAPRLLPDFNMSIASAVLFRLWSTLRLPYCRHQSQWYIAHSRIST